MYPQGRICFSCGTCLMCLFVLYVILALWISVARFVFCLCFNRFYHGVRSCFVWRTKAEPKARVGRPQLIQAPPASPPLWETAVHLTVAGGVYDGVFLCWPFSHEMSWMRSWTYLS